jgi:hypothetical protein
VLCSLALLLVEPARYYLRQLGLAREGVTGLARAGAIPVAEDRAAAVRYVQQITRADEAIYSGLPFHDRIFINDVLFYFLAGRRAATRYPELHPGQATEEPVQREIASDLERGAVHCVVVFDPGTTEWEDNDSGLTSGVHLLDEYIRNHYAVDQRFGRYAVLRRKTAAAAR